MRYAKMHTAIKYDEVSLTWYYVEAILCKNHVKSSWQPRKEAQHHPFLAKPDKPWGQFELKYHKFNRRAETRVCQENSKPHYHFYKCQRGELLFFIRHQHTESIHRLIYNRNNMMNKLSSQISHGLHSEEMIDLMYENVEMMFKW